MDADIPAEHSRVLHLGEHLLLPAGRILEDVLEVGDVAGLDVAEQVSAVAGVAELGARAGVRADVHRGAVGECHAERWQGPVPDTVGA